MLGASESAAHDQLRRFEREAQATATLSSQHTIRLFDFGAADDGSFYYVMELLSGRDLESLVNEFGPLPPARAMYLLRQVCHSLAEAHARGLVHRDVKPANIFVCRMGLDYDFVKVLDFGLVQTRKADPALAITETLQHGGAIDRHARLHGAGIDPRARTTSIAGPTSMPLAAWPTFCSPASACSRTARRCRRWSITSTPCPSRRREGADRRARRRRARAPVPQEEARRAAQDATELLTLLSATPATSQSWTGAHAQIWWETHLPEFGPTQVVEPAIP